jgi:chemotaxis-related protein WspB
MLVLLLRLGDQCFGLDAHDVVAVVPSVPLLPVPHGPAWLAGLLRRRDRLVPIVDLGLLARGVPSAALLSTRIVVLEGRDGDGSDTVGLLAERVTETARIDPDRLRVASVDGAAAWLGPIALDDPSAHQPASTSAGSREPVRLVRWTELVPAEIRAALHTGAAA